MSGRLLRIDDARSIQTRVESQVESAALGLFSSGLPQALAAIRWVVVLPSLVAPA